jgi:hypothetical protein
MWKRVYSVRHLSIFIIDGSTPSFSPFVGYLLFYQALQVTARNENFDRVSFVYYTSSSFINPLIMSNANMAGNPAELEMLSAACNPTLHKLD